MSSAKNHTLIWTGLVFVTVLAAARIQITYEIGKLEARVEEVERLVLQLEQEINNIKGHRRILCHKFPTKLNKH